MTGCRIVGVGENSRADDAAGLLTARALREAGVAAEELTDPFRLPLLLEGAPCAILIDAVLCDAPLGAVLAFDAPLHLNGLRFPVSSHGFGLAEILQLSEALGLLPPRVRVYGISARHFELGAPVSPEVLAGAGRAAQLILDEIGFTPGPSA